MNICKHFRYEIPHELSDELRNADPLPCDVCDVLQHRRVRPFSEGMFNFPVQFGANVDEKRNPQLKVIIGNPPPNHGGPN
jgi:hypothetical protein